VFEDLALPSLLKSLDPKARDELRRLLVRDLIDFLLLHKEEGGRRCSCSARSRLPSSVRENGPGGRTERDSPVVRVTGERLGPPSNPRVRLPPVIGAAWR
jgi:hypothetical protein